MSKNYIPNISYNKRRVHRSKHYTIMIPDDAILEKNVKSLGDSMNREFIAYLSPDDDCTPDTAPICFFPHQILMDVKLQ